MDTLGQFIAIVLLILLNAFFVAAEFSLVAIRRTRVDELVRTGSRTAKRVQKALSTLDIYISSTQLGITLASLALGWIGEPAVASPLERLFHFLPAKAALISSHTIATAIAFAVITFLHIVLGELIPKTLALQRSGSLAFVIITPLAIFTTIFKPFIWFLNYSGTLIIRVIGLKPYAHSQNDHSEEEIKMILTQSGRHGTIPADEVEMMHNVFRLGEIPVKKIMVPRTDIIAFDHTIPIKDLIEKIKHNAHSRFPIYEHTLDNIIGFIHIKDIYKLTLRGTVQDKPLKDSGAIRDIIYVPENRNAHDILLLMRKKWIHLAVVSDEYGGTAGIISIEDIIENLVGEIQDEFDVPLHRIKKHKDESYSIDARTAIEKVRKRLKTPLKEHGYTTIGGLIFGLIGHMPKVGDKIMLGDLEFQVENMSNKEIKTIRVKRILPSS